MLQREQMPPGRLAQQRRGLPALPAGEHGRAQRIAGGAAQTQRGQTQTAQRGAHPRRAGVDRRFPASRVAQLHTAGPLRGLSGAHVVHQRGVAKVAKRALAAVKSKGFAVVPKAPRPRQRLANHRQPAQDAPRQQAHSPDQPPRQQNRIEQHQSGKQRRRARRRQRRGRGAHTVPEHPHGPLVMPRQSGGQVLGENPPVHSPGRFRAAPQGAMLHSADVKARAQHVEQRPIALRRIAVGVGKTQRSPLPSHVQYRRLRLRFRAPVHVPGSAALTAPGKRRRTLFLVHRRLPVPLRERGLYCYIMLQKYPVMLRKHIVMLQKYPVMLRKHTVMLQKHPAILQKHPVMLRAVAASRK